VLVRRLVNEKRVPAQDEIDDAQLPRTRSDVVPRDKVQVGSGAPPRLSSGLRPAVQFPPPAALSEHDLVDDESWDDESGPTLTDAEAPARAQAELEHAIQEALQEEEPEFSHDDFPTRQAMAPTFETVEQDSTPELPPPIFSADDTAQMPSAPRQNPLFELPEQPPPSSISRIPYSLPTPISMSGTPLPPPANVQNAFMRAISPNDDPPLKKLAMVTLLAFLSTLISAAFLAWIVYLIKH
jgi:hypothetical protein